MIKNIITIALVVSLTYSALLSITFYKTLNAHTINVLHLDSKIDSLTVELDYCSYANNTNYDICRELQAECDKWTTYATRIKRICGVPDTIDLSYNVKCKYHLETRNLVGKHAIFK